MWYRRLSVLLDWSSKVGSLPAHLLHALQLRAYHLSGEAYLQQLSVVVITMSTCEPAHSVVSCYPRHGKHVPR